MGGQKWSESEERALDTAAALLGDKVPRDPERWTARVTAGRLFHDAFTNETRGLVDLATRERSLKSTAVHYTHMTWLRKYNIYRTLSPRALWGVLGEVLTQQSVIIYPAQARTRPNRI